ncbi:3-hydroxyacyl-CoA dehydrogenase [Geothrix limicola]|uniref:3-hydroxyacyl-CoA dehydrogenase n=1 Tax=Geothrix limicola TaxID=2927978 RepID=A0ABQ5QD75_9BACT|nr:3-hydroxybutyryl-CoA dehydrogenase [Geothrix limicola]GLH72095.1 3-hydroxyacyl-CoA dehydrogenase [Geothrix limicola]
MSIQTIGVIGAGQMGNGIAHVFAQAGFQVLMQDISEAFTQKGLATIDKNLQRGVDKGKMSAEEKTAVLGRVKLTTRLEDLADCDLVIEAATEKWEVKKLIFETLDAACKPGTILASNTSSISITKLAAVTKRPEAFIGMHFMNPVPVMQLIEVIRGLATSEATFEAVMELSRKLGKTPIPCNDFPGFVSNRVLMPMINEAIYALYEGVASVESIDGIMKLGMNHPMGPLALADFIGLDSCLFILNVLREGLGDPKYRPCPLLIKYVDAGWLGKKSGRGFYDYAKA